MIIVKIVGGLGNQMFQYAFARSLAHRAQKEVRLDVSDFETYKLHSYGLEHFNIEKNYATKKELLRFKRYQKKRGRVWLLYNLLVANDQKYVKEKFPHFDPHILDVRGGAYLDGYWQSEKYFLPVADELRKAFTPREALSREAAALREHMSASASISLHARRGDYVTNKKVAALLGACEPSYYQNALSQALRGLTNPHVFVFSDDTSWVKKEITIPCQKTYVSDLGLQNWEELLLMSYCQRHVISNSSFSWWGAWLDPREDKLVIAPTPWFRDPRFENKDIAPDSWLRIP